MAATSIAEIKRLVGKNSLWNICETGNAGEISLATPKPLTLFVVPLDRWKIEDYHEVKVGDQGVQP